MSGEETTQQGNIKQVKKSGTETEEIEGKGNITIIPGTAIQQGTNVAFLPDFVEAPCYVCCDNWQIDLDEHIRSSFVRS